jgi:transcriptional regulator with XRE-family HTH domain
VITQDSSENTTETDAVSLAPDIAEIRVADRLRHFRREKGLTLKKLAEAALLSQAYLSRIENHQLSLTITALERLARVLGVPIASFFEHDSGVKPITTSRDGEGQRELLRGLPGFYYQTLAADKLGKLLEPLIVDITPEMGAVPMQGHVGEEFDYVLEGEFILVYGKSEYRMRKGDSAYFDASVPHAARPAGDQACRLLVTVASVDYMFHGDLQRLLKGERE